MVHLTLAKDSKSLSLLFCCLMFNSHHLNSLRQRWRTANGISSASFMGYFCPSVQGALLQPKTMSTFWPPLHSELWWWLDLLPKYPGIQIILPKWTTKKKQQPQKHHPTPTLLKPGSKQAMDRWLLVGAHRSTNKPLHSPPASFPSLEVNIWDDSTVQKNVSFRYPGWSRKSQVLETLMRNCISLWPTAGMLKLSLLQGASCPPPFPIPWNQHKIKWPTHLSKVCILRIWRDGLTSLGH